MEENAKGQDGSDKMLSISISILMLNKLHVLLHFSLRVEILWYVSNIFSFLN